MCSSSLLVGHMTNNKDYGDYSPSAQESSLPGAICSSKRLNSLWDPAAALLTHLQTTTQLAQRPVLTLHWWSSVWGVFRPPLQDSSVSSIQNLLQLDTCHGKQAPSPYIVAGKRCLKTQLISVFWDIFKNSVSIIDCFGIFKEHPSAGLSIFIRSLEWAYICSGQSHWKFSSSYSSAPPSSFIYFCYLKNSSILPIVHNWPAQIEIKQLVSALFFPVSTVLLTVLSTVPMASSTVSLAFFSTVSPTVSTTSSFSIFSFDLANFLTNWPLCAQKAIILFCYSPDIFKTDKYTD